jgi:hypothetical protein
MNIITEFASQRYAPGDSEETTLKTAKKIVLLHENVRPHMANLTKAAMAAVGWEIVNHPPYSPGLASSDLHLFGPMKVHVGVQKFRADDELKRSVKNWLSSQDETFLCCWHH